MGVEMPQTGVLNSSTKVASTGNYQRVQRRSQAAGYISSAWNCGMPEVIDVEVNLDLCERIYIW